MTIYIGSRYEKATIDFIAPDASLEAAPVVFYSFPGPTSTYTYSEYLWKTGDRLEAVAAKYYGYPELWWLIAQANPQVADHVFIPAGTVLRVPNV